jgi:hypothetical protein
LQPKRAVERGSSVAGPAARELEQSERAPQRDRARRARKAFAANGHRLVAASVLAQEIDQRRSRIDERRRRANRKTQLLQRLTVLAAVAQEGFDPVYGARPLKRAIQQQIENPLATEILKGSFAPGDTVHVTSKNGKVGFAKR